jgi:hypothetical protein
MSLREKYIDEIDYLQDLLCVVRDRNEQWDSITEYDSVCGDICDYQDNDFEDFETDEDLKEFIDYLKDLIISGINE